jgi:hypothetical protein
VARRLQEDLADLEDWWVEPVMSRSAARMAGGLDLDLAGHEVDEPALGLTP